MEVSEDLIIIIMDQNFRDEMRTTPLTRSSREPKRKRGENFVCQTVHVKYCDSITHTSVEEGLSFSENWIGVIMQRRQQKWYLGTSWEAEKQARNWWKMGI